MDAPDLPRRTLLRQGGASLVGLGLLHSALLARAFPSRPGEEVVPWLDQPPANPSGGVVENLPQWEELGSWLTPNNKFFRVAHYNKPVIDENGWTLKIDGLVKQPMALSLRSRWRPMSMPKPSETMSCWAMVQSIKTRF